MHEAHDVDLIKNTVTISAAFVSNNTIAVADIPGMIQTVYGTLAKLGEPEPAPALVPAVSVKRSITADAIVCLECGTRHKMLKRHLHTAHGMTPDEYRAKWDLPADYPMTAPNYAALRSEKAKVIGLGTHRTRQAAE